METILTEKVLIDISKNKKSVFMPFFLIYYCSLGSNCPTELYSSFQRIKRSDVRKEDFRFVFSFFNFCCKVLNVHLFAT